MARDVNKREFQHKKLFPPVKSLQPPGLDAGYVYNEDTSESSGTLPTDFCVIVIVDKSKINTLLSKRTIYVEI